MHSTTHFLIYTRISIYTSISPYIPESQSIIRLIIRNILFHIFYLIVKGLIWKKKQSFSCLQPCSLTLIIYDSWWIESACGYHLCKRQKLFTISPNSLWAVVSQKAANNRFSGHAFDLSLWWLLWNWFFILLYSIIKMILSAIVDPNFLIQNSFIRRINWVGEWHRPKWIK